MAAILFLIRIFIDYNESNYLFIDGRVSSIFGSRVGLESLQIFHAQALPAKVLKLQSH